MTQGWFSEDANQIFAEIDEDEGGLVSLEEFIHWFADHNNSTAAQAGDEADNVDHGTSNSDVMFTEKVERNKDGNQEDRKEPLTHDALHRQLIQTLHSMMHDKSVDHSGISTNCTIAHKANRSASRLPLLRPSLTCAHYGRRKQSGTH